MKKRFQHLVIGGTFDHFHTGHKYLIDQAFLYGEKVSIGVTANIFITQKNLAQLIQPYALRLKNVKDYISSRRNLSRSRFFMIHDLYGTAAMDPTLEAIVVTHQTYGNANKINAARIKNGLKKLKIITIPLKKAEDLRTISSTRVRNGEIDRDGLVYRYIFKKSHRLILPHRLRYKLRQPVGQVLKGKENQLLQVAKNVGQFLKNKKPLLVISVGDIITASLMKAGHEPDLAIVDLKNRRQNIPDDEKFRLLPYVKNPSGALSETASEAVRRALQEILRTKKKITLRIQGEEDLLTMAAVLHAPLNSYVVYGQVDLGVIVIEVTEKAKAYNTGLLRQFQAT